MNYEDGRSIELGDVITIDVQYRGTIVGIIERELYQAPHTHSQWGYLRSGLIVDTDFGGVVHYPSIEALIDENVGLVSRSDQ